MKKVGPWRGGRKRAGKRRVIMVCFEKHLDLSQRGTGVSIGENDELRLLGEAWRKSGSELDSR